VWRAMRTGGRQGKPGGARPPAHRPSLLALVLVLGGGPAMAAAQDAPRPGAPPTGLPLYVAIPATNPITPERVALGRELFFDPILSVDRSVSCSSCHRPSHFFADTVAQSVGARGARPTRNTPSILNAGYGGPYFWDGRVPTLEEQVLRPVTNPAEMALPLEDAVERLRSDPTYLESFETTFGEAGPDSPAAVSRQNLSTALAAYVRSLRSAGSRADLFIAGEVEIMSSAERDGYRLFVGKAGCTHCHAGPLFSDERLHNTGVGWGGPDAGRFQFTGQAGDRGLFNTPSLRNVAETAPYMHDGSMRTLREVAEFYDRGGGANPNLDARIEPLSLTEPEIEALVAFLRALTSPADRPSGQR
jgi:cytochrome c peroxidase